MPTRRIRPLEVMSFTSFLGSEGFFLGLPEAGRWTCRLMSPGSTYCPPKSTVSYPAGAAPSVTAAIRLPSTQMTFPVWGAISRVPSSSTPFTSA